MGAGISCNKRPARWFEWAACPQNESGVLQEKVLMMGSTGCNTEACQVFSVCKSSPQ